MMEVIIDNNTNINKEKSIIESLELSIKEDKTRNDYKSIKYHTMALEKHKEILSELENKTQDNLEIEM